MKTRKYLQLFTFIACIALFIAMPSTLYAVEKISTLVHDPSNVLKKSDLQRLEKQAQDLLLKHNVAMYTIIEPVMAVKDERYIDDHVYKFADFYHQNLSIKEDMVLLFICVESGNRWREILAFGDVHKKLTSSRLKDIQDNITPDLTKGNYAKAINDYYIMADDYIEKGEPIVGNIIAHIIILLISSTIAYFIVRHLIKTAGGVMTVCHKTYSADSRVTNKGDVYTHTTITKTKVQSSSSSRSGGGGSSRGGGGRF